MKIDFTIFDPIIEKNVLNQAKKISFQEFIDQIMDQGHQISFSDHITKLVIDKDYSMDISDIINDYSFAESQIKRVISGEKPIEFFSDTKIEELFNINL